MPQKSLALALAVLMLSLAITIPSSLAQTFDITYDANGNRQEGLGFYYEYDDFNKLVRVRQDNSTGPVIEEYVYDEGDQRLKKYEPQIDQTTYYIDRNWIRIVNTSGTFDYTYYYDGDTLVGKMDPDGSKYFYHPDHLGSTTLITDENGDVVEEITYEPYGKHFSGGSDRFMYTGKELDAGTGLQYYGARYYDPAYAQFTQPDWIIQDVYNPQNLNRYAYTLNNPYKYNDPSGNQIKYAILPIIVYILVIASEYQTALSMAAARFSAIRILNSDLLFPGEEDIGPDMDLNQINNPKIEGIGPELTDPGEIGGQIGEMIKDQVNVLNSNLPILLGDKHSDTCTKTSTEKTQEARNSYLNVVINFEFNNQITLNRQEAIDSFFETSLPKTLEAFQAYLEENT